jgi:hypothetical protein
VRKQKLSEKFDVYVSKIYSPFLFVPDRIFFISVTRFSQFFQVRFFSGGWWGGCPVGGGAGSWLTMRNFDLQRHKKMKQNHFEGERNHQIETSTKTQKSPFLSFSFYM